MYDFLLIVSLVVFAATVIAYLRHPAASLAHPASFYLIFHGFSSTFRQPMEQQTPAERRRALAAKASRG